MTDPVPFKRPVNWSRLRPGDAERIIRERARNSANVIVHKDAHATLRVAERDIPAPEMYRILREGYVEGEPIRNVQGDWEAVIRRRIKGTRDAGVATIILTRSEQIIVKTVMWMDYRK